MSILNRMPFYHKTFVDIFVYTFDRFIAIHPEITIHMRGWQATYKTRTFSRFFVIFFQKDKE